MISRWTGLLSPGTDRSELDAEMTPTPVKDVCVCVSVDKCAWRGLQCNTIYAIYRLFYFHPSMFLLQYIDRQNENEAMMQLQKKNTVKKAQTALNLILL